MKNLFQFLFTLFLLSSFTSFSQESSNDLNSRLEANIDAIRNAESANTINWMNEDDKTITAAFSTLKSATEDSLSSIRRQAYQWVKMAYLSANNNNLKINLVDVYVKGLKDENESISANIVSGLQQFSDDHFSKESRRLMVSDLNPRPSYYSELVLALAYINEESAITPMIDHIRYEFKEMDQMEKWNVHIALSRLGEQPALDYVVKKAKALPVNDDVIYEIYPSLAFTRQKKAVDILVEKVFSENKNCSSPDPDSSEKINCAYRVLEMIAPIIKDFPLEYDSASGDLAVEDYPKALKTAIKWLKKNRENYEII